MTPITPNAHMQRKSCISFKGENWLQLESNAMYLLQTGNFIMPNYLRLPACFYISPAVIKLSTSSSAQTFGNKQPKLVVCAAQTASTHAIEQDDMCQCIFTMLIAARTPAKLFSRFHLVETYTCCIECVWFWHQELQSGVGIALRWQGQSTWSGCLCLHWPLSSLLRQQGQGGALLRSQLQDCGFQKKIARHVQVCNQKVNTSFYAPSLMSATIFRILFFETCSNCMRRSFNSKSDALHFSTPHICISAKSALDTAGLSESEIEPYSNTKTDCLCTKRFGCVKNYSWIVLCLHTDVSAVFHFIERHFDGQVALAKEAREHAVVAIEKEPSSDLAHHLMGRSANSYYPLLVKRAGLISSTIPNCRLILLSTVRPSMS